LTVEFTKLAEEGLRSPVPLWATKKRLPEWAVRTKELWRQRSEGGREAMLEAVQGGKDA
jgi:hypothetical protein